MAFRDDISRELARQALDRFLAGEIDIAERRHEELSAQAWQIAADFGWAKTYDAEYIALARLLGCRLVTLDARLRRGTERLRFIVTPNEV
jgi:predicted nucleic acid-binding protein